MAPHVERVLVSLGLVLVLEAVATEAALILLFSFVSARWMSQHPPTMTKREKLGRFKKRQLLPSSSSRMRLITYLSSSAVSNFLGFLGQHSHM